MLYLYLELCRKLRKYIYLIKVFPPEWSPTVLFYMGIVLIPPLSNIWLNDNCLSDI